MNHADVAARYLREVAAPGPGPAAAVQFPVTHPAVATVLVGARSPEEITDSMTWLSTPEPRALWSEAKRDGSTTPARS